jgi:hypothetical protein
MTGQNGPCGKCGQTPRSAQPRVQVLNPWVAAGLLGRDLGQGEQVRDRPVGVAHGGDGLRQRKPIKPQEDLCPWPSGV